jgi:hypothetical protein
VVREFLYLLGWWHFDNFRARGVWRDLSRKAIFVQKIINESFLNKFVVMCCFWVVMASFEDNFLRYYQSRKFQESDDDPFVSCSVKRKCLSQLYLASVTLWVSITIVLTYICVTFVSNIVHITMLWSRMHGAFITTFPLSFPFVHIHRTSLT